MSAGAPNGNGRRDWRVIVGIPGAALAMLMVAMWFQNAIAVPAIKEGAASAVERLLTSETFWARVEQVSRGEAEKLLSSHERTERDLAAERARRAERLEQTAAEVQARLRDLERRR